LPVTVEAGSELLPFTIGERLTPHVRHRQKYVDVPVSDDRAFVFRGARGTTAVRAHTLREFVDVVENLQLGDADGYFRRGDFSRWISDVFGDHALARELRGHERTYVQSKSANALSLVVGAITSRYELAEESEATLA
jgi:hypothetical protein